MSICINKLWQHINSHYKCAVIFATYLSWQFQPGNTSSQGRRGLLHPLSPEHRHLYSSWGSFGLEILQDGYQCPPCRIQGHPPLEHTGLRIAMTNLLREVRSLLYQGQDTVYHSHSQLLLLLADHEELSLNSIYYNDRSDLVVEIHFLEFLWI